MHSTLIVWRECTGLVPGRIKQNAKFMSCVTSVLYRLVSIP